MSQMHFMPLYAQSKPSNVLPYENIPFTFYQGSFYSLIENSDI